ncbi:MAG: pyrroline-5-carboxylate reductase [Gammaproteobacteria bacterium]|nr:MAG: pyrroline-5-carboxylate reductase [Gammaproteobacteria bacterium]
MEKIGFIGCGNMAASIIGGMVSGDFDPKIIYATDSDNAKLADISEKFGINTLNSNAELVSVCDIVVLAVKPQVMHDIIDALSPEIRNLKNKLYISIAAGIKQSTLKRWIGENATVIRTMPNTPSLIGKGVTGIYAEQNTASEKVEKTIQIMSAVGTDIIVKEERLLDTITAISGSGPAYYFMVMEVMIDSAIGLGLDKESATKAVIGTALGAAAMAQAQINETAPAALRKNVTSPNGTTEKAIASFQADGIGTVFDKAVNAAYSRSQELADDFDKVK